MRVWALFFLFVSAAHAKHEQYIGWKSYYVTPASRDQLVSYVSLREQFDLDFLSHASVQREGVVLVKPEYQTDFTKALDDLGITYRVHSDDVKKSLEIDDERMQTRKMEAAARNGGRSLPYDDYQELAVIDAYLDQMAATYPNLVTLVTPANSFEGRPIKYLRISTTNFQDTSKPVIIIDGGIHAREWISPPTVTWAIHKLVEDLTEPDLLERFDWILLPVANPDGYQFTFSTERFWRKTRSTDQHENGAACPGVDGNRNYDFFWNTIGTSANPCSDVFAGSQAFSEIETRVVRDIVLQYLPRTALYLTMHSYGSMILYPWGHDGSLSHHALALHSVGVAMGDAVDAAALPLFPRYLVGNSVMVVGYPAAGASEDYAHSVGVTLSYTYELPGLEGGFQGFHLDPQYIQQVCIETWAGIVAGARRAGDLFQGINTQL